MKHNLSMQDAFFFMILIALSIGFYNVISPFLTDILLTGILVLLFQKPFRFFRKKFKNKQKRAAGVTVLLVIFVIVIPLTFIGFMITNEATENYELIKDKIPEIKEQLTEENIKKYVEDIPILNKFAENIKIEDYNEKLGELISKATEYTVVLIEDTFTGITFMIIHSFIILFLMYYLLIDGEKLIKRIQYLIPLKDEDERELLNKIKRVTSAIVVNSFMIGVIEGTYGGVLFAILGISSPFFWGFIMAVLSIIPLVGTNSVMVPMIIYQFIIGDYTTATLLLIFGTGVVLINQNIIRPKLDGNKSGMHTAIVFLASLGGLLWMGIIGFLAGPLLAGMFITIWNQFGIKYQSKLEQYNKGEEITEKAEE